LPIEQHPSFRRPPISTRLWRYTDLAKFVDLLTSQKLWLTNAEILASEDPYEGLPDSVQFPHRILACTEDLPKEFWAQIVRTYDPDNVKTPQATFHEWIMLQEQLCIMRQFGRRQYYVNCWHAADHESVAMWKIYGSPGAGVAIVTNGARLEEALSQSSESLYLGAVGYQDPDMFTIGATNAFDKLMLKRVNYSYEREVRLIHWDTRDSHDPLSNFLWNEEKMRFDDIVEDNRPLTSGLLLGIDVDVLIERVIVSPIAPQWYLPMIERLKEQLNFKFPVIKSKILNPPEIVP